MKAKNIIGRTIQVNFPQIGVKNVYTRVDTGAKTCAIWVSSIVRHGDDMLEVIFFDKGSSYFTGETISFKEFSETVVASSNGKAEHRYKVKLQTELSGRKINASFTLADRSNQSYPVLLGRNILRNKFVVDVSVGDVNLESEVRRTKKLKKLLIQGL